MNAVATALDLVSLIEQTAGIRLTKKATTGSGEYWGMCPFCSAGEDRFHVWPASARPHYWCRHCNASGDAIQWLRDYSNMTYIEACQELGIEPDSSGWTGDASEQRYDKPPLPKWQEAALLIVERAEKYLWHPKSPEGQQALAYLRGRGFTDETIKKARLGYVPLTKEGPNKGRWYFAEFETWGLNPEDLSPEQLKKGGVRVPDGILIPWFEADTLWKLAVKRPGESMSYGQVLGSSEGMYNIDSVVHARPCMMVEGEFDALSIIQEAGDLVSVVATGSATRGRSSYWVGNLKLADAPILQSFDEDEAGDDGALFWLKAFEGSIERWSPSFCNDPNEMLCKQDGPCTLREWVQFGIEAILGKPELVDVPEPAPTLAREPELALPTLQHVTDASNMFEEPEPELPTTRPQTPYSPVTLPSMPREACPHEVAVSEWRRNAVEHRVHHPCKGATLEHGWCAYHQKSHELLCLGATLNYPAIQVHQCRSIGSGVENWEGYAEAAPEKWLTRDIAYIRSKYRS